MLVLAAAGVAIGAQETGENNFNTIAGRPAETELLLNDAESPGPAAEGETPQDLPGVGFGDVARMILVLGVVIALVYGFFWLLKRFSGARPEGGDVIHVISTRPLKGDAALHLVEIGRRVFFVGSSGNGVSLLSEIDDKESVDEIRLEVTRNPQTATGGFARFFRDRFGGGPAAETPGPGDDHAAYLRRQKERLKDL